MTLPLYGVAQYARGFQTEGSRQVLRMRTPASGPPHPADMALIRSLSDVESAVEQGFTGAVAIGDVGTHETSVPDSIDRVISISARFDYLADGDVIAIQADARRFRTLYRRRSAHNSFLVTERCNHYCLMCSQPPKDINDDWILDDIQSSLPLIDKETQSLGFTGGEPLLDWERFVRVLSECRDILPNTAIHVLSNGRAFADTQVVSAWAGVQHPNLTVGIPVYSAVDHVHDYVVQALGAFDETVLGILKLKDKGQRVEIRVVLHAITAPRIVETCRWLARNLPFVDHVALMGLENTGFAIANEELLWIDPMDYRDALAEGADILESARVKFSIYNLPRCVIAPSVWPSAMQSISDWKNGFADECDNCIEKPRCSGFFTSGRPRRSRGIRAMTTAAAG